MSLINTMLQELDQRRGRPGGEAIPGDPIRSVKRESPWHLGRNALLLALAIVATGLAIAWWLQQRNSARPGPIVSAAAPTPLPATAVQTMPPRLQPAQAVATAPAAAPVPHRVVARSSELATPPAKKVATVALARADNASPASAKTAPPVVAAEAPPVARVATASPTVTDATLPGKPESADVQPSPSKSGAPGSAIVSKTYSAKQSSANLIAEAVRLDQKGRQEEAKAPLQRLLATDPRDVEARQMLIQLQLDTGNVEEARALSSEGQRLFPEEPSFTLGLARLQVEAGDVGGAVELLEARQAGAHGDPQYHALLGALLLRVRRYDDAVQHYLVALRSDPANANWLVGAGVAFEGVGNTSDARAAYRRAEGSAGLNPESARFLAERLASIGR